MARSNVALAVAAAVCLSTATLRTQDGAGPDPVQAAAFAAEAAKMFPEGAGKSDTIRVCVRCHSGDRILEKRLVRQEWEETMANMIVRGAEISDDEQPVVLDYLAAQFRLEVNVNTATADEIQGAFGLRRDDAVAIVEYREKHGTFKTLDDLKQVPDIEFKRIQLKKDAVRF